MEMDHPIAGKISVPGMNLLFSLAPSLINCAFALNGEHMKIL